MEDDVSLRFEKLEIKNSYIEDFVQQLQEVVAEHSKLIEVLREENRVLSAKLNDALELVQAEIPNRKPPHY